ncbi:peptidase S1 and S6, chymotrypsin/Hap [Deinococcus phoenicis]|uniref:Peptidase S1 and S6, chymotrypsin/Hap n=1 Tax=Deinococcus phoenicis TaxID=1476583 RepID=A0A016QNI0_9DEIO|nr:trypsin-like peptidase domain-containing protein [Deinococcus phoenicis]EYB67437.1 peptidase S1 and S6, chymotrypsin/Hap [Deinococcus phoenicis]
MTNFSDISAGIADAAQSAGNSVVTVVGGGPVSGTVIADGQVLTVAHVLHGDEVSVWTADGRELPGTVLGRDPVTDLALVRVEGLNVTPFAPSAGARLGELLLAVGRPPHGLQVSLGLMERESAPERGPLRGWLHAGAAPFRGVSGGALVDARGGLVGVLNAGVQRGHLLAVPVARALRTAGALAESGRMPRGFLGLATQPVHFPDPTQTEQGEEAWEARRGRGGPHRHGSDSRGPDRRGPQGWGPDQRGPWGRGGRGGPWGPRGRGGQVGLTVVQVEDGSPAAQAGLLVGDVVLALDGEALRDPRELLERVRERAGEPLSLRVLRGGQETDLTVTVGER